MDNEISFLPEYSDPEEESSDDSDGTFDVQHISPRRATSSSKSTSPHSASPDEVEETPETNSAQGDEKKPAPVSYHDHTRRPGRPFLHQHKGLRRRPYLIFNQTPSHRLKELPKSEKKRSIFASRTNLGDGFSDNEAKHSGLVLLTRNGRHSGSGPNFGPLDVTQSRSPKAKGKTMEENVRNKRKSRRTERDDNSFAPLPKKQKKTTEREKSKATKQDKQQTPPQENASSERTIVNSDVLDLAKEQDQTVETLPKVTNKEAGDDTTPHDNTKETEPPETSLTEEQNQVNPSSDESVQFIIPNSDDMSLLLAHIPRHAIIAGPKPSCSWETYIPESSDMGRASSMPAPTRLSHTKEASEVNPAEEQQPSSPSLPLLLGDLKEQVSFSLDTKSQAPLQRTLRRINTQ
ncbi:hypothetical protein QBC43DRAFT_368778 [Cladorrhinum sp. PSN259]|nr:hypothetical protein QBC43DRAFT_368778 [Cladorrhinum sp. PSN259]